MARQLPNQRTQYTTRVKRLDEHLVKPCCPATAGR
jgi:hypothetical protein